MLRAQTIPGIITARHGVLAVWTDRGGVDGPPWTEVVLLAKLPKNTMISAI
jgi:hypothetical protein